MRLALITLVAASLAQAASVSGIKISGKESAEIVFQTSADSTPQIKVEGGTIELTFNDATLSEGVIEAAESLPQHLLVRRVSVYSPDKGIVRSRIITNGTTDGLDKRVQVVKVKDGVALKIATPNGEAAAKALLQDESQPLSAALAPEKRAGTSSSASAWVLCFVLLGTSVAGFFFMRFLKNKGVVRGSRKHLIEQITYHPINQKAGVTLLKVGTEFVLVGVTPNQVSMLTTLPKLGEQYQAESKLERDDFKLAVEQEYQRLTKKGAMASQ